MCGDGTEASTKLPALEDSPSKKTAAVEETSMVKPRYRYRLFPEGQTSYLWYDGHGRLPARGQTHVDTNVIENRYPSLEPFYFEWQETYESAFERQECHLGSAPNSSGLLIRILNRTRSDQFRTSSSSIYSVQD